VTGSPDRRPRLAFLEYSTGAFDSRARRMANSAIAAGFDVTLYGRWEPGLALEDAPYGFPMIRVPVDPLMAVPGLRALGRRRVRTGAARGHRSVPVPTGERRRGLAGRARRVWSARRWASFPASIMGWVAALEEVVEPADIWHGMWIAGLPAAVRMRSRFGGAALYDSRDVYLQSRELARLPPRLREPLALIERRWARRVDAVLTANDAYAEMLEEQLRVPRPIVAYNCPERWDVPEPRPDLIRERLGLPATTRIALYHGGLTTDRGIRPAMDAVLRVPDAALVLLGYGAWRDQLVEDTASPPYRGRVFVLDAVTPEQLLPWVASADAAVMAIEDTSPNHRFTTPNKLFEAMAAGTPVVASDLPGMAAIVRATGCGVLVDPGSVDSVAAGLDQVLHASPESARGHGRAVRPRASRDVRLGDAGGTAAQAVRAAARNGTRPRRHLTGDQLQPAPSRRTWRGRVA
jgi:glycosyltransferase involved in cell wall biosynthesis